MHERIETRRHGHVGEVVFANPPFNHATVGLLRGIVAALREFDADPAVRAVVLASDGKPFCAGADLAAPAGGGVGGSGADPLGEFYGLAVEVFRIRKPWVAAVQGAAVGAGLGLAIAADFRVAAPEARFAANFTALGFHPGFALSHTLPRLVGPQRAHLMMMTSRRIKAEDGLSWGLVDEVVPLAELRPAAHRLAAEIAANAPLALAATRRTLRAGLAEAAETALRHEHATQLALQKTEDYVEGVRAVFERRPASFKGR